MAQAWPGLLAAHRCFCTGWTRYPMWVPRSATADWSADDCIGISVLDCLQCDGTGTVRLDPGRANRPTRSGR